MAYVPIELLKCVVFLGFKNEREEYRVAGSAFWVSRAAPSDIQDVYRPAYLVTAGHVIEYIRSKSASTDPRVWVRVNIGESKGSWIDVYNGSWKFHHDATVDLAVLKIGIENDWDHAAWPLEDSVSAETLSENDFAVEHGDEVFFSGLFWLHPGNGRNIPIVRVGNIAALRDEPVLTKFGRSDAYLIDAHSISGFSGSPVFIDTVAAKRERELSTSPRLGSKRFLLLGVMHGHYHAPHEEPEVVVDDGSEEGKVNTGICIIIPADKIGKIIHLSFQVEEEREIEGYRQTKSEAVIQAGPDAGPTSNTTIQTTQGGVHISKPDKKKT
jgi:hypothetical protein